MKQKLAEYGLGPNDFDKGESKKCWGEDFWSWVSILLSDINAHLLSNDMIGLVLENEERNTSIINESLRCTFYFMRHVVYLI